MYTLYFRNLRNAVKFINNYAINNNTPLIHIKQKSRSSITEIGQVACIDIEDDNLNVIYRIFYDESLWELQDSRDQY